MIERLELIEQRYNEINNMLMDSSIVSDINKSRELSKELSNIEDTVEAFRKYKKILNDLEESREMAHDIEIAEFAHEEITRIELEIKEMEKQLELLLIPKDKNDGKNVIVEIRGAAGGDEGNIFAGDLYRMYTKYAEKCGYSIELLNSIDGEAGGFTIVEFMIKGKNVYSKFKYESGAHRVSKWPNSNINRYSFSNARSR